MKLSSNPEIDKEESKNFSSSKQNLTVTENLFLKNKQFTIPKVLHKKTIELAQERHMGITKAKMLIRESIY